MFWYLVRYRAQIIYKYYIKPGISMNPWRCRVISSLHQFTFLLEAINSRTEMKIEQKKIVGFFNNFPHLSHLAAWKRIESSKILRFRPFSRRNPSSLICKEKLDCNEFERRKKILLGCFLVFPYIFFLFISIHPAFFCVLNVDVSNIIFGSAFLGIQQICRLFQDSVCWLGSKTIH